MEHGVIIFKLELRDHLLECFIGPLLHVLRLPEIVAGIPCATLACQLLVLLHLDRLRHVLHGFHHFELLFLLLLGSCDCSALLRCLLSDLFEFFLGLCSSFFVSFKFLLIDISGFHGRWKLHDGGKHCFTNRSLESASDPIAPGSWLLTCNFHIQFVIFLVEFKQFDFSLTLLNAI